MLLRGGGADTIMCMHTYENIISLNNLFTAWEEFLKGKRKRKDVIEFSLNLSENIYNLHSELKNKSYVHSTYESFNIRDPKPRNIHKASVRDRLLHHVIYRVLYPYFDNKFISDSYSCRLRKGTHKAMDRFRKFSYEVSKNNTKQCWVLKCDIRKFFASIDHDTLMNILKKHIKDENILWLLNEIISSFHVNPIGLSYGVTGLPLGNLTSQLLVNVYMNEFDQYMKQGLRVKYYIRYADDFVILSQEKQELINLLQYIVVKLEELKLVLHPSKVSIKTLNSGIDFLGWIHFPNHRVLRTSTKRRMFKKLAEDNYQKETLQSYLGLLKHGDTWNIRNKL